MTIAKKVLIITYYWPPSGGGGVQRWLKFSKYLPEFGWQPIVYTPLNPHFMTADRSLLNEVDNRVEVIKRYIWEPYRLARIKTNAGIEKRNSTSIKQIIAKWVRANLLLPDPRLFWVKPSIKYLNEYLEDQNISHVITTGPPHSMHFIGLGLKQKNPKISWIADFRDPMSEFNFYQKLNPAQWAVRRLKKMESKIVSKADLVIGTSPSTCEFLTDCDNSKYQCVTNGWDEEDFKNYKDESSEEHKYVLLHPGSIKSDRIPNNLFITLDRMLGSGIIDPSQFELRIVGNIDVKVFTSLATYKNLNSVTKNLPYVSHPTLIATHYAEASGLLLLVNDSLSSKANIPGKLFEYFALEKPILAIGKNTDDAMKLLQTSGIKGYDYNNEINDKDLLMSMQTIPRISKKEYSRKNLTKSLVGLLNQLDTTA